MNGKPYRVPNETEPLPPARIVCRWWLLVAYSMPLLVATPFMNHDGWYGVGVSGVLQRGMQVAAFLVGTGAAYFVSVRGTALQKFLAIPVALGYTILFVVWFIRP